MRACLCCGNPIAKKNQYGYCSRTPECRSRYQQAWQDARRPPTMPPAQPCKSCGLPTTAKSGYCKRTKTCDAARSRAEWTREKGFAKYKPGEPRRCCLSCGKWLNLGISDYTALCRDCDGTRQSHHNRGVKAEVMRAYGGACACCGEDNIDFLTIDHIDGDGHTERKGSDGEHRRYGGQNYYKRLKAAGFPDWHRLQVLCFNCNCAKGNKSSCPCQKQHLSVYDISAPEQLTLF